MNGVSYTGPELRESYHNMPYKQSGTPLYAAIPAKAGISQPSCVVGALSFRAESRNLSGRPHPARRT